MTIIFKIYGKLYFFSCLFPMPDVFVSFTLTMGVDIGYLTSCVQIHSYTWITGKCDDVSFNWYRFFFQLKHTGKFVLDLLISLTKHMDLKSIQYLLSLVGNLAVGSHTKQTLLLASLLTRRVWSSTLATGVRVKQNKVKETSVPGKQCKYLS